MHPTAFRSGLWRTKPQVLVGLTLLASPMFDAQAADLQVIVGSGISAPMRALAAQFEAATGHRLLMRFGTTPELSKMATSGPFDLGVVPIDVMKDAAAWAQFSGAPGIGVARVGLGVAVRAGAARPDIGSTEAFEQALLSALSVATVPASAAGVPDAGQSS